VSVRDLYTRTLAERGYQPDPAQLHAVDSLERCENEWADYKARRGNALTKLISRPPIPRGVYMHGGVGRGKSFLMDCFFNAVPLAAQDEAALPRVHARGASRAGRPARRRQSVAGARPAHRAALPADLLRRVPRLGHHRRDDPAPLLQALFENRVSIVTTSNFAPDDLYPNGLHRDRILPAIDLLKERLEVISVDAGVDYRQLTLQQVAIYHTPLGPAADEAMREAFER
jgi:cell division protein ZapE